MHTIISQNNSIIEKYANDTNTVSAIHPEDLIFKFLIENPVFTSVDLAIKYYFVDGQTSAKKLSDLLFNELGFGQESSLLEFASGYGCVTRHLTNKLNAKNIVSSDIHQAACSFIESTFSVKSILSSSTPEELKIVDNSFDAVFALSFFSHMPDQTWGRWLSALYNKVKPGGHLIFTTQGLVSAKFFGTPTIPENGIWFIPVSEQTDLDSNEYGNTLVTSKYVNQKVKECLNTQVIMFAEADWWGHQDLYVVKKN